MSEYRDKILAEREAEQNYLRETMRLRGFVIKKPDESPDAYVNRVTLAVKAWSR